MNINVYPDAISIKNPFNQKIKMPWQLISFPSMHLLIVNLTFKTEKNIDICILTIKVRIAKYGRIKGISAFYFSRPGEWPD